MPPKLFSHAANLFDQGDILAAYALYQQAAEQYGHKVVAYDLRRCEAALSKKSHSDKKSIHAFVISWEGQQDNAVNISKLISHGVDKLTVIYSNKNNEPHHGTGNWSQVDSSVFFGGKFKRALDLFEEDVFLLIHADAEYDDWPHLVSVCRSVMADDRVGIWGPDIDYTPWNTERVKLAEVTISGFSQYVVAHTDAIVAAFSRGVANRLKRLSYDGNNLGWGIDWAAICYCYARQYYVVRDREVKVNHPNVTGYSGQQALLEMNSFIEQLSPDEKIMYILLNKYMNCGLDGKMYPVFSLTKAK